MRQVATTALFGDHLAIGPVDYADPAHGEALFRLLDLYAREPVGGSRPLDPAQRAPLLDGLAATPGAFSLLAWAGDQAVGLVNCFTAFSTFAARPLINVHDVVVDPAWRGRGVARALFDALEQRARAIGAAKVTLEVLSGNAPAQALYRSLGFENYELNPDMGHALYWQKVL